MRRPERAVVMSRAVSMSPFRGTRAARGWSEIRRRAAVVSARKEGAFGDRVLGDRPPADQVLLDDPVEDGRLAAPVPDPLRIDDGDRPARADPQAVRLRPLDPALLREPELLQAALQVLPRLE